jgi:Phasin protein
MTISKEQLVVVRKANIEAVLKLGLLSLEHAERLVDLNLHNAKIALEHGTFSATALASVKNFRGLFALHRELADVGIQETIEYSRAVHRVAADAEYDFSALTEVAWTTHAKAIEAWFHAPAASDISMRAQVA